MLTGRRGKGRRKAGKKERKKKRAIVWKVRQNQEQSKNE